ncbi:MAG: hypothetical protein V4441_09730 [Pseudomonadota bacterium]
MKALQNKSATPTLAHIALSVFAIIALLMFNATGNADGISQSDVDYAMLQTVMQRVER